MRALVFGGQGSLITGLGKDLYQEYPLIKPHYDETALKRTVRNFVFTETDLNTKPLAQLGLLQFYMAMTDIVNSFKLEYQISFGLSLGTYGALYAVDGLEGNLLFDLVNQRSIIMSEVASSLSTGLLALLGVDAEEVKRLLNNANEAGMSLYFANDNAQGQIVIGGRTEDLESFKVSLTKSKIKSILLPVNAAFHTPYMKEAEILFQNVLKNYHFSKFNKPIIDNRTADIMDQSNLIKALSSHLTQTVRFRESLIYAAAMGVDEFLVIDAGKTIESFIKKTLGKETKITTLNNIKSIETIVMRKL